MARIPRFVGSRVFLGASVYPFSIRLHLFKVWELKRTAAWLLMSGKKAKKQMKSWLFPGHMAYFRGQSVARQDYEQNSNHAHDAMYFFQCLSTHERNSTGMCVRTTKKVKCKEVTNLRICATTCGALVQTEHMRPLSRRNQGYSIGGNQHQSQ